MVLGYLVQDTWTFVNDSIDLYKDIHVENTLWFFNTHKWFGRDADFKNSSRRLCCDIPWHRTKALVRFCIYTQANKEIWRDSTQSSHSARPPTPAFAGLAFIPASCFSEKTNNPLKIVSVSATTWFSESFCRETDSHY